jgi:low temperature requirement protein LtrA
MTERDAPPQRSLFRPREKQGHHRVTFVELFFDLVFVFAVTQLSHQLLERFTPLGALQTALCTFAVWWVWIYTSWITNWLDPERAPVRLMLFALMIAGLALSTSIPEAFEGRGLVFATAYVAMQIGRTLFMLGTIPAADTALRRHFLRVLVWLILAAVFWICGAFYDGPARLTLWLVALALDYVSPAVRFWTPRLGASSVRDWAIEGGHIAERCSLFVIIALGESVLVTGASFSHADWTGSTLTAFAVAFVGSLAMWWIYFDTGAESGSEQISHAAVPGSLARLAYTYLQLPIVAGIILTAVANELLLASPNGHVAWKTAISWLGGPLAYLVGMLLFKRAIRGRFQLSHLVGIASLLALCPVGRLLSPLALAASVVFLLSVVAGWETLSLRGKSGQRASAEGPRAP